MRTVNVVPGAFPGRQTDIFSDAYPQTDNTLNRGTFIIRPQHLKVVPETEKQRPLLNAPSGFINRIDMKAVFEPKTIEVTAVFTDIVNSTGLRHAWGDAEYRLRLKELFQLKNETLSEIAGEWAWMKALGDGSLTIFGTANYFRFRPDRKHAQEAAEFSQQLLQKLADIKLAKYFQLRIGIDSGKTLIEETQSCGSRQLDFDGHPVIIAKRIESLGKRILKARKEKRSCIFLGPGAMDHLNNNFSEVDLSTLKCPLKDYPEIKTIGEIL